MSMTSELHRPPGPAEEEPERFVHELIARMTLEEKAGQLTQLQSTGGHVPDELAAAVRAGRIGSLLNEVDPATVDALQRIAVAESRLGIPLLIGRDVIHGFRTILPLPLGQACSWSPELIERGARMSAREATAVGVRWTFAPMVDIGRDPRWGRVAECLGEDPLLSGVLAAAMVRGFQGDDLSDRTSLAACAKHFAGYGASESGRDYNSTFIPEGELRSVHLPPFRAALEAGVATFMASFSDINGIPASANRFLMTDVLREEWGFEGFVVSDWESIAQLVVHGLAEDGRDATAQAFEAGIDMDMADGLYVEHLPGLIDEGRLDVDQLDNSVARVLELKRQLGLFDRASVDVTRAETEAAGAPPEAHLDLAREAALHSIVLLRNDGDVLPLDATALRRIAVVGPLADEPQEQLGTWVFDGDASLSQTPLDALQLHLAQAGHGAEIRYIRGLETARSDDRSALDDVRAAAAWADATLLFVGEEAVLSGEAHSRADLTLPGAQNELIQAARGASDGPVIVVLLAGRPLALESIVESTDALLCAWHPGTMGGPAIVDLLFGVENPSGRLVMTFPRVTGQVPIYYAHRNTGRPPTPDTYVHMRDLPRGASQLSTGNTSYHLDTHYTPLFNFGFGLSYTRFEYADVRAHADEMPLDGSITLSAEVRNVGSRRGIEVVQLYTHDVVASVTRPVRELKGFERIELDPGQARRVSFTLRADDLAFPGRDQRWVTEPGRIDFGIGGDATVPLSGRFTIVEGSLG